MENTGTEIKNGDTAAAPEGDNPEQAKGRIEKKRWFRAHRRKAKESFRELIREKRRKLKTTWIAARSRLIQKKAVDLEQMRNASSVFCYIAAPGEVLTDRVLKFCFKKGKQLYIPAWDAVYKRYVAAEYGPDDTLVPGPMQILQPEKIRPACKPVDVAVVPGMAFDLTGVRVGHGCGHYDRIFKDRLFKSTYKIGLGFAFQVFDSAPANRRDARMNAVVTEAEVFLAKKSNKKN